MHAIGNGVSSIQGAAGRSAAALQSALCCPATHPRISPPLEVPDRQIPNLEPPHHFHMARKACKDSKDFKILYCALQAMPSSSLFYKMLSSSPYASNHCIFLLLQCMTPNLCRATWHVVHLWRSLSTFKSPTFTIGGFPEQGLAVMPLSISDRTRTRNPTAFLQRVPVDKSICTASAHVEMEMKDKCK
eukprot:4578242-Amphidinium_carterae.1